MHMDYPTEIPVSAGRIVARATVGSRRSWTGRSALSRATSTPLSAFATTGTHKSRVSEMRHAARWGMRHPERPSPIATADPDPGPQSSLT